MTKNTASGYYSKYQNQWNLDKHKDITLKLVYTSVIYTIVISNNANDCYLSFTYLGSLGIQQ